MGLFKKKNTISIDSSNGIHSLMGSEKGIEVHSDKIILVNKKIPALSKKLEFRFLESINLIPSTKSHQGCLEFKEKYIITPTRFRYAQSQEENIKTLLKIALQNFDAFKSKQQDNVFNNASLAKSENTSKKINASQNYYNRFCSGGIKTYQLIYDCSELPNRFVMLDLETTGLSNYRDRIIEIAMIKYVNGQKEDVYHQLLDPETPIPYAASQVNGITDDMVKNQPKIYEVIDDIYSFINGEIIAGYNIDFDLKFLSVALARSDKQIDNVIALDVLQVVKENIPPNMTKDRKLQTIKNYFDIENDSHRALADCETAFQVLNRCLKMKENLRLQAEAEQMERLSKLNDAEKAFIAALEKQLESINKKEMLSYNILSDKTINFKIQNMQIGRVKLRGKKYTMQILDKNNVLWLDIENAEEAINNIKHWIKYCKYLAS